jgi:threonine synthase
MDWILECSACGRAESADGLPSVCSCGLPWLVRYPSRKLSPADRARLSGTGMWRYRALLPLDPGEAPVSLGEGGTPLLRLDRTGEAFGLADLWLKDESTNPTGSFKARGLAAAVTRAVAAGAKRFVIPTAGNAGVAASAYAARAGATARVYAPSSTPATILAQIRIFGGELITIDGHIGDCGKASRAYAAEQGAMDLSTLREPYRIEGKKTLGFELAEAFDWRLPDAIIYPTGGGTGLIGMWKAFKELVDAGWIRGRLPRMYSVQAAGCAPIVTAFEEGNERAVTWVNPQTIASGLRVPGPLGDRLILQALRESGGGAIAVTDDDLAGTAARRAATEGVDLSPEGGAALAAARIARERGWIRPDDRTIAFNTGAGWLYRSPGDLPGR